MPLITLTQSSSGKTLQVSVTQSGCEETKCTCEVEGWLDMNINDSNISAPILEVAYCMTPIKSNSTCNIATPTITMVFNIPEAGNWVENVINVNWDSPSCSTLYRNVPQGTGIQNVRCDISSTSGCSTKSVTINRN